MPERPDELPARVDGEPCACAERGLSWCLDCYVPSRPAASAPQPLADVLATRAVMRAAARRPRPRSLRVTLLVLKLAATYLLALHPAWVIGRALLPVDHAGQGPDAAWTLLLSALIAFLGAPVVRWMWRRGD